MPRTFCDAGRGYWHRQSTTEIDQLLHDFQAYQVELELENGQLQSTQEHLQRTAYHYHMLYDFAPTSYILTDTAGAILETNSTFVRLLGVERRDLLRRRFTNFVQGDDRVRYEQHIAAAQRTPGVHTCEIALWHASGTLLEVQLETVTRSVQQHCRLFSVIVDRTEHNRAAREQQALRQQMQEHEHLESMGLLAGGIAHDLNNLLLVIGGNAELASEALAADHATQTNLEAVVKAVRDASHLLKQVLLFAGSGRIDLGSHDLNAADRRGAATARGRGAEARKPAPRPARRADLCCGRCSSAAPDLAQPHPERRRRDWRGWRYDHARISAMRSSRPTIWRAAAISDTALPGRFGFIRVNDTGCGMDEATLGRIFDPYFSTKLSGNGLGLAMVRTIVRLHSGALQVHSRPGLGTTFTIFLPLAGDGRSAGPVEKAHAKLRRRVCKQASAAAFRRHSAPSWLFADWPQGARTPSVTPTPAPPDRRRADLS